MNDINDVAMSVGALANAAAARMARLSVTNIELREAITTVKLGPNAIRVGGWDILLTRDGDYKTYSIRSSRNETIVLEGIAFYDTAQIIVRILNGGGALRGHRVKRIMMKNDLYVRSRDEADFQAQRSDYLIDIGEGQKADDADNLRLIAEARCSVLYPDIVAPLDF